MTHQDLSVLVSIIVLVLALIAWAIWDMKRKSQRHKSLRKEKDANGRDIYVWTALNGSETQSYTDPAKPGGEWHSEGGFGAGGDSGDGGGGD